MREGLKEVAVFLDVFLVGHGEPLQPFDVTTEDGFITAITPSPSVRSSSPSPTSRSTSTIAARNLYLAPSLVDNHVHFSGWAINSVRLQLGDCQTAAQVFPELRAYIKAGTGGRRQEDWIVGHALKAGELPDIGDINRISLDKIEKHRAILLCEFFTLHFFVHSSLLPFSPRFGQSLQDCIRFTPTQKL